MFSKKLVLFTGLLIAICITQTNVFKTNNAQACKCMRGEKCAFGACITMDPTGTSSSSTDHISWTNWSGTNISVCTIGAAYNRFCVGSSGCESASYKYCAETKCGIFIGGVDKWKTGSDTSVSGDSCKVTTLGQDTCSHVVTGKWDKSEGKCVTCTNNKETAVAGDRTANYVISSGGYVVSAIGIGKADLEFEHACGADTDCDEKKEGNTCDTGKTCDANGACVAATGLSLAASASPTAIALSGTSTITFKVTKSGADVSGATVNSISVTGGGNVSAGTTGNDCLSKNTDSSGECTVIYNAPAASAVATIKATKATKTGETESGEASVNVTVSNTTFECSIGDSTKWYDPGPPEEIGSCSSLNGDSCGSGGYESCGPCVESNCPDGTFSSCFSKYQVCGCTCTVATCTESWGAWSAWSVCSAGSQSRTRSDSNGCSSDQTQTRDCCTTTDIAPNDGIHDDCVGASGPKCDTSFPNGKCVECVINDDCVGTDVCYDGSCTPCSGEGDVPHASSASLCCEGLNYWDKNFDGNPVCTSACDPGASFYCNTLRKTVDTIVQSGEKMIGYILGLIGSVALLLVIIAGIMYMTAAGVEEKVTSAKKILTGAAIGLGIALLAFSLLQVILSVLNM